MNAITNKRHGFRLAIRMCKHTSRTPEISRRTTLAASEAARTPRATYSHEVDCLMTIGLHGRKDQPSRVGKGALFAPSPPGKAQVGTLRFAHPTKSGSETAASARPDNW